MKFNGDLSMKQKLLVYLVVSHSQVGMLSVVHTSFDDLKPISRAAPARRKAHAPKGGPIVISSEGSGNASGPSSEGEGSRSRSPTAMLLNAIDSDSGIMHHVLGEHLMLLHCSVGMDMVLDGVRREMAKQREGLMLQQEGGKTKETPMDMDVEHKAAGAGLVMTLPMSGKEHKKVSEQLIVHVPVVGISKTDNAREEYASTSESGKTSSSGKPDTPMEVNSPKQGIPVSPWLMDGKHMLQTWMPGIGFGDAAPSAASVGSQSPPLSMLPSLSASSSTSSPAHHVPPMSLLPTTSGSPASCSLSPVSCSLSPASRSLSPEADSEGGSSGSTTSLPLVLTLGAAATAGLSRVFASLGKIGKSIIANPATQHAAGRFMGLRSQQAFPVVVLEPSEHRGGCNHEIALV